jgi:hypothetical protein
MKSRYKVFELIVLLGVAALLLVVAAMFYPAININRQMSWRLSCQWKLKAIGQAMTLYASDYDGTFPQNGRPTTSNTSWAQAIQPYLSNTDELVCESKRMDTAEGVLLTPQAVDYYFNANLSSKHKKMFKTASKTLLFGEGQMASSNYACLDFENCIGFNADGPVGAVPLSARTRHFDGANYVFVNGHVTWLKPEKIGPHPVSGVRASFALE